MDLIDRILKDAASRDSFNTYQMEWYAFPQTWSSGSLGFGGYSGQEITSAQTYIVVGMNAHIYFGGQYAYSTDTKNGIQYAREFCAPGKNDPKYSPIKITTEE